MRLGDSTDLGDFGTTNYLSILVENRALFFLNQGLFTVCEGEALLDFGNCRGNGSLSLVRVSTLFAWFLTDSNFSKVSFSGLF